MHPAFSHTATALIAGLLAAWGMWSHMTVQDAAYKAALLSSTRAEVAELRATQDEENVLVPRELMPMVAAAAAECPTDKPAQAIPVPPKPKKAGK